MHFAFLTYIVKLIPTCLYLPLYKMNETRTNSTMPASAQLPWLVEYYYPLGFLLQYATSVL